MNEMSEQQVLEILKKKIKKIDDLERDVLELKEMISTPVKPKGFLESLGQALQEDLGDKE